MLVSVLAGLGLGFSLIIAIGAQNLFVLRQGLRREHVLLAAGICALSDAVLIVLGVSGIGLVLQAVPWLFDVVRWAGAVFLVGYGLLAARRAWVPAGDGLRVDGDAEPDPRSSGGTGVATATRTSSVVLTCLALTWLNPHVWLDTVVLLGSVSAQYPGEGVAFALGATTASFVFFFALGFGARALAPVFARPAAWRVLDLCVGAVMWAIAAKLVLS